MSKFDAFIQDIIPKNKAYSDEKNVLETIEAHTKTLKVREIYIFIMCCALKST